MTLSKQVEDSLREAQSDLRNALAFAARSEKPYISKHIADYLASIDNLIDVSGHLEKLEEIIKENEQGT